jgi:hypothetical protein
MAAIIPVPITARLNSQVLDNAIDSTNESIPLFFLPLFSDLSFTEGRSSLSGLILFLP